MKSLINLLIVSCILMVAVTDFDSYALKWMTILWVKWLGVIAVIGSFLYNPTTGVFVLMLFLLLLVQTNAQTISEGKSKKEKFVAKVRANECDSTNDKDKNELSESILNYSIDSKVKPYEVYIKMMTSGEHLEKAANDALIHD